VSREPIQFVFLIVSHHIHIFMFFQSSTMLMWFTLAMIAFPEAQRKAQAELDEVVGRGRLPSFSDWDHLPYIRALAKEVI
jgi:Cytochrome P450